MTPGHPRPQLVREGSRSLDGPWGFAVDHRDEGVRSRWFDDPAPSASDPFTRTITVPFPPESAASGIGEDIRSPIWYRRAFEHEQHDDERLLLHLEGVDHRASVWVNGAHVAEHEGSQARFTVDVTDAALVGTNHVVLRVVDEPDLEQPRGKQDWRPDPHTIWYRRTSGIWRSVWLEAVPATRIDRLVLTPQADLASVRVEARLAGPLPDGTTLELELRHEGRLLARVTTACGTSLVRSVVTLDHEGLEVEPETLWWTPESPRLIDVTATVAREGVAIDTVTSYTGLRTVTTEGGRVLLNNRPYFLRLVLEQAYWPESHLASPSLAALEQEVRLIKELGFNGIRMHQTSADPRFLACCDRLGLVVLADAAATYRFSDVALTRTVAEMSDLVRRDAGHPCVIGWVPYNESWGVPDLTGSAAQRAAVEALYSLLKALDPGRLAIANDGWEFTVGDFVGVHDYAQDARVLRRRYATRESVRGTLTSERPGGRRLVLPGGEERAARVPVLLTEFGGLSVHDDSGAWAAYGDVLAPDELASRLEALVAPIREGSGLAGYCYTQLTDTLQEKNGLLTETREPKCAPERIRAALLGAGTGDEASLTRDPDSADG